MCKFDARAWLSINMQITRRKSAIYGGLSNVSKIAHARYHNALTVYCLLNQRTQIAQIVIHKMNTYAFMNQTLAIIVFLQILMWALSKTPLKILLQGKKQFAKFRMLQIEEGENENENENVYYIYTCVTLTFRTEVLERLSMTLRQTAKMKLLPSVFNRPYCRVKIFLFAVNSRRHLSIFM